MKRLLLICTISVIARVVACQSELIVGIRFERFPDVEIEKKIQNQDINYVDALDYKFLEVLNTDLSKKYKLRYRQVTQVGRDSALLTKDTALRVDMLLYSYSNSFDRRVNKQIQFTAPYFINRYGIGLFSKSKNLGGEDINNGPHRIAVITNSTADTEVKTIADSSNKRIHIVHCNSYEDMIDSLNSKAACMVAADVSRMTYYIFKHKDIVYVDQLRTLMANSADGFCVAIRPGLRGLKDEIDDILKQHDGLKDDQEKFMEEKIKYVLATQVSSADRLSKSKWLWLGIPALVFVLMGLFMWYFMQKRMQNSIGEAEMKTLKEALQMATPQILESVNITYNSLSVWEKGIQSLKECKNSILYVGSGGYMSSKGEEGAKWREAIYGCLNRKIEFLRIVDLPEKEFLFRKKKSADYIARFYTWLVIQYLDLKRYPDNLVLYDSRGASFWGVGNIMLFKDESSVLIFTSSDKGKMGTLLENTSLVPPLRKDILETTEFGEKVSHTDIMERYFKGYPILLTLVSKVSDTLMPNEVISEELMKMIEKRVREHVDSLEELEVDNSAPL